MSDRAPIEPEQLRVEQPRGDTPSEDVACADCGAYQTLFGPVTFDGEVADGGDFVCRSCAETRGVDHNLEAENDA